MDFFSKMTFLGELNSAIVIMAVVYWCCSKSFGSYLLMGWSGNRLANGVLIIKTWIPGAAGSLISCFIQMFYVTFIHPWFIKRFEKPAAQPVPA